MAWLCKQFKINEISGICPWCKKQITLKFSNFKRTHFICPNCNIEFFFRWDLRCLKYILPYKAKELLEELKIKKKKGKKEKQK